MLQKLGFGGGCHWCTEAVFLSLKGVQLVKQGWIASSGEHASFSEGVIVEYEHTLPLHILLAIHLHTHSATSDHQMRNKYRSAVYYFSDEQVAEIKNKLDDLQKEFDKPLVTQILRFCDFKENVKEQLNYYYSDPERPFCQSYIDPKLKFIFSRFSDVADDSKVTQLLNKQSKQS